MCPFVLKQNVLREISACAFNRRLLTITKLHCWTRLIYYYIWITLSLKVYYENNNENGFRKVSNVISCIDVLN